MYPSRMKNVIFRTKSTNRCKICSFFLPCRRSQKSKILPITALDEYSRFRYVEAFNEHSSYSSTVFLEHLIKALRFPIYCIQADNWQEFTKRLSKTHNPTLFEKTLQKHSIFFTQTYQTLYP